MNKNYQKSPGGHKNAGFTLIELLVVVLIIGILSAVALPQYQKAVEKSRAAQPLTLLKSLAQAQQTYFMANGQYASKFDQLDVEMPWTGKETWRSADSSVKDTRSNGQWSLQLFSAGGMSGIYMGRLTGSYKGAGWIYWLEHGSLPVNRLYCAERIGLGLTFVKSSGDYCHGVFGSSAKSWSDSGINVYPM